jgi:hypothetical protein
MKATGHVCISVDGGPLLCETFECDTDRIVMEPTYGRRGAYPTASPIIREWLEAVFEAFREPQPQPRQTEPLSR